MQILIDNHSGAPIYDQIFSQIKAQIISGALARDLRVSFITTKRAYDELEREGFLYTVPGKGSFVAPRNVALLREENLRKIEGHLDQIIKLAASCGLSRQELLGMMAAYMEDDV